MVGSLFSKAIFAVLVAQEAYGSADTGLAYRSSRGLSPRDALENVCLATNLPI